MYECIIVGGGPAGITSGIYLSRKKIKSLLITKDFIGQVGASSLVENYLGFESINGINLIKKFKKHLENNLNTEVVEGEIVEEIKKKGDIFTVVTNINKYKTKTIIIASGATYRKTGVPGEEEFYGKGVTHCSICDAPLFQDKIVVVVGGGNSGISAIIDLIPYARKISLLTRNQLKADQILVDKIKNQKNVFIFLNSEIKKIRGDKKVNAVDFFDRKNNKNFIIPTHGVFIKVGVSPNTSFLVSNEFKNLLDGTKEFMINNYDCSTKIPGLFGAGDVTNIKDKQIATAVGEGCKAALSVYKFLIGC